MSRPRRYPKHLLSIEDPIPKWLLLTQQRYYHCRREANAFRLWDTKPRFTLAHRECGAVDAFHAGLPVDEEKAAVRLLMMDVCNTLKRARYDAELDRDSAGISFVTVYIKRHT